MISQANRLHAAMQSPGVMKPIFVPKATSHPSPYAILWAESLSVTLKFDEWIVLSTGVNVD
jgi:hypothetical protein